MLVISKPFELESSFKKWVKGFFNYFLGSGPGRGRSPVEWGEIPDSGFRPDSVRIPSPPQALGVLRQALGGLRQALGGLRQALGGLRLALGVLRQALGVLRQALGGLTQALEGLRQALGGLRQAPGGFRQALDWPGMPHTAYRP